MTQRKYPKSYSLDTMQAEDEKRAEQEAYSSSQRRVEQERRQDWQRRVQTQATNECIALQVAEKQRLQALDRAAEKAYAHSVQRYLRAVDSVYHQQEEKHKLRNAQWREDLSTQVCAKPKVPQLDDSFSPAEAQMNWTIIQHVRRGVARSPINGNALTPQQHEMYRRLQQYSPNPRDFPALH